MPIGNEWLQWRQAELAVENGASHVGLRGFWQHCQVSAHAAIEQTVRNDPCRTLYG